VAYYPPSRHPLCHSSPFFKKITDDGSPPGAFFLVVVLGACNILLNACRDVTTERSHVHFFMLTRQVNYMMVAFFAAYTLDLPLASDLLLVISPAVFCMFGMFILAFCVRGSGMELVSASSLVSHILVPFTGAYILCFTCVRSGAGHVALSFLPFALTIAGQVASVARGVYIYGTLDVTKHTKVIAAIPVVCMSVFWAVRFGVEALCVDAETGSVVPVSDPARWGVCGAMVVILVAAIASRSYNEGRGTVCMGATAYDTPD
jgi:hypothetical protein